METIQIPAELAASLAEIYSDLGYILDNGLEVETMETIEDLYNRAEDLMTKISTNKVA